MFELLNTETNITINIRFKVKIQENPTKFIKEKEKSNLIRLVSTKLGQTHWTITPVFAKLILFCKSRMVAVDGFNGSEENC